MYHYLKYVLLYTNEVHLSYTGGEENKRSSSSLGKDYNLTRKAWKERRIIDSYIKKYKMVRTINKTEFISGMESPV